MKKSLIFLSIAIAWFGSGILLSQTVTIITKPLIAYYDLDSTSDISFISTDIPALPNALIVTSGSATTTSAKVANTAPFIRAAVGDIIQSDVVVDAVTTQRALRIITVKGSNDSITTDSAWNLGTVGKGFLLWRPTVGATSSSHWITTGGNSKTIISWNISQLNLASGGIGIKIEAAGSLTNDPAISPINVWPGDITTSTGCFEGTWASGYCVYTAVSSHSFDTNGYLPSALRMKIKLTGADDGVDTGALAERFSAQLTEVK